MPQSHLNQETYYRLLKQLEENPRINQRELARSLGVSLGKTNYCLRALIARGLIKKPDVLILNDATSPLDPTTENQVIDNLLELLAGKGLIAVLSRLELARRFEYTVVFENGKVVEQGRVAELSESGGAFQKLLQAG